MTRGPAESPHSGNRLAGIDPRLKLAWLACVSLISVVVDTPVALGTLAGATLVAALGLGWSARTWLAVGSLLAAVIWGTVLSQAIFFRGDGTAPLATIVPGFTIGGFAFPGIALFAAGAQYGLLQSLRVVAMILAGLSVCLSTSPDRLLAGLAAVRVPAALSFMLVASLRFLPTIAEEWSLVRQSCRLRGYRARLATHPLATLHMEAALVVPVVASSLRRAATLATSLSARGFDATRPRTAYPVLAMTRSERVLLAGLVAATAAISAAKSVYWLAALGVVDTASVGALHVWVARWL